MSATVKQNDVDTYSKCWNIWKIIFKNVYNNSCYNLFTTAAVYRYHEPILKTITSYTYKCVKVLSSCSTRSVRQYKKSRKLVQNADANRCRCTQEVKKRNAPWLFFCKNNVNENSWMNGRIIMCTKRDSQDEWNNWIASLDLWASLCRRKRQLGILMQLLWNTWVLKKLRFYSSV